MARRLKLPADSGVLAQFREAFHRADFTVPAITARSGNTGITELKSRSPRLLHATREGTPLDILIRLFVAGIPVTLAEAQGALGPVPLAALAEAGVLRLTSRSAVPLVTILPHDDLVLVSDQPFRSGKAFDYVPGMLDSSAFLELLTIRWPCAATLDLGAGCGIQSLRAALHSEQVVATDVNPRALDFARFNAALNNAAKIEFLRGSGFDPVAHRSFDLVVSNLPFAITPSERYAYRDSGMKLDDFAHRIISEVPAYLNDGGWCQLLFQWVEIEGQDWRDRLREWFEGNGCDVWVMKNESRAPDSYAEKWIADTEPCPPEGVSLLFEQWMDYYERERIVAIHSGALSMRRRAGSNWLRMDEGPDRAASPFGGAVLRAFAVRDYLETARDRDLLAACLRLSPDVHLIQRCECSNGSWHIEACQMRFHRELEYAANIDQFVSNLVSRCTGQRPLGDLIGELAAQTGIAADRLTAPCLQLVRGLIERGFLLPQF